MAVLSELCTRAKAKVAWRPSGLILTIVVAAVMVAASLQPASAQYCTTGTSGTLGCGGVATQEAINQAVQNTVLNVREGVMQSLQGHTDPFNSFNSMGPVSASSSLDPNFASSFNAMPSSGSSSGPMYRKAVGPDWLYGVNLIGSGDKGTAINTDVSVTSVVGAVDVTKIGIFSSTDALTFIGTGIHSWSDIRNQYMDPVNATIPSTSATLVYLNGGFSTDLSVLASWTATNAPLMADTSAIGYTANFQYRKDGPNGPNGWWFEPTAGLTYGESYNGSFSEKTSDSTEIHGGLRLGTETKWMGYTWQPSFAGTAFKVVNQNGLEQFNFANPMVNPAGASGFRGSAKMTVLWQKNFSSYIDFHASTMQSQDMPNVQVLGVQGGVRYTF